MADEFAPDPENQLAPADHSYGASEGRTFLGEPLQPFSVRRQFAAQALGNKLLCGRLSLEEGGAYDGMAVDVAVLIYLCRCPQSEVLRAARRPEEVLGRALDWAEEVGLSMGSPAFAEACQIFGDLMSEVRENQFSVQEKESGSSKNA